jgi:glycosyltransferase involved in cell wall biosynthesis
MIGKNETFSQILALEKAGKYQTAFELLKKTLDDNNNNSAVKSLNLILVEQRLRARLKLDQAQTKNSEQEIKNTQELQETSNRPKWSAIITMWKRQDYLSEQLTAIRSQIIPPVEIIIILNEGHIHESKIREIGGSDITIIRSEINSLYSRWAVAYIAKGEYVSVFDDDVIPGQYWIANAIRACSSYNALVGPAGRIYNKHGHHGYFKLVVPGTDGPHTISCSETDVYCDWVCNSYLFKREWVGHALSHLRYQDSFKTFDDIQLATSLYVSGGIRCVTPMQTSFDKEQHGILQPHYGNDSHAIWKTNSDQHFASRKAYIEELIEGGYVPVQKRDYLYRFHLIVPFGERNTLERCLLTIKGQDYQNFTCTLIDDCCDGKDALDLVKRIGLDKSSVRYLKTTKKAYPLRAREIATDMLGANPADIIVHIDGDDWLPYPDVLSRLHRTYRKGGVLATYGNAISLRQSGRCDFHEYSPYEMSRRWNVTQQSADAEVVPFRKIKETELVSGWKDAPWCGMHLRTFQFSKWLGHTRESFRDKNGAYLKVGTDAAIFIPILDSCKYDHVAFVQDLSYVYQNSSNTIHAKKEITSDQKSTALSTVANAPVTINQSRISSALVSFPRSISASDVTVVLDSIKETPPTLIGSTLSIFENNQHGTSSIVTIVTPNYLADAIVCLMSYRCNLRDNCDLFAFIATEDEDEIECCLRILAGSGVNGIFPTTLQYSKKESQNLAEKYQLDTDEYRWAMKAVVLIELLNRNYSLSLFLDPDTYTVSDITDVHQILGRHPISVFPHFRDPDHEYLRGVLYKDGFFNGGMLAATPSGIPHLRRLYDRCLNELKKDPARHRWDDQKYFDLFALEVKTLYVNHDRGINYNPWNYEPVEGLIAPSQRSVILKSGYFVRHWHVSTMLIKNSIELKEQKFSVYRPIIAIYLLSLMYSIFLILAFAKSKKIILGEGWLGLEARFDSLAEKLNQLSSSISVSEMKSLFDAITQSSNNDCNQMLQRCVESISNSICFDNYELFASFLLRMFPDNQVASSLADDLRRRDLRYIADNAIGSADLNQEGIAEWLNKVNSGDLVKQRLRALQSCNITY